MIPLSRCPDSSFKKRENSDDLTEYEVLGDGPEADCVLEGIPAGLFLAHHLRLPGRGLCWVGAQEGIIFVVLQTGQRL